MDRQLLKSRRPVRALAVQRRSHAEALCVERIKNRLQGRQHARLSRLYEHTERPAHRQSALLRNRPTKTLVDRQEVGV
jgi:hypothetical protein